MAIENQLEPKPHLLVPILEGMVYHEDDTPIQEMFYNLLKTLWDKTKKELCHPAFPKILSQLSVDEIMLLIKFTDRKFRIPSPDPDIRRKQHINKLEFLKQLYHSTNLRLYCYHLDSLSLVDSSKDISVYPYYTSYITEFGEQFLKACLNERSEELIKDIINNKEQKNDQ
ncbi:MAG: Abi-alpha family protein [Brevinemataceae bacterium]